MVRAVAEDPCFRAFAGVAGVYTDNAKTKAMMGDAYQATFDRGRAAERKWRETVLDVSNAPCHRHRARRRRGPWPGRRTPIATAHMVMAASTTSAIRAGLTIGTNRLMPSLSSM
jgi:hypothetical protein